MLRSYGLISVSRRSCDSSGRTGLMTETTEPQLDVTAASAGGGDGFASCFEGGLMGLFDAEDGCHRARAP